MVLSIAAPRPSRAADPLDAFSAFHEAIRDVAAWAEWLVDDTGSGSPREARWLVAFLTGPLAWHFNDEEVFLFPRLQGVSPALDEQIERCFVDRGELERAGIALAERAQAIARGERVQHALWLEAVKTFATAAERTLAHEDGVMLPTARLRLDEETRALLRGELVTCEEARAWEHADGAAAEARTCAVHTVLVRRAEGEVRRRYASCPRGASVALEDCRRCEHAEQVVADDAHPTRVSCSLEESATRAETVADRMTRELRAVEPDAPLTGAVQLMSDAGVSGLPVVDARGHPVGMITRGDVVSSLAAHGHAHRVADVMTHLAFCVREDDPLEKARALLVAEGIHRVLVVNAASELVGVLTTLDVMRALRPA